MVDIAAEGYTRDKTLEKLVSLYELLSNNSQQKAIRGKRIGVYEVGASKDLGS